VNAKDVFGIVVRTVGLLAVVTWPLAVLAVILVFQEMAGLILWPLCFYLLFALYLLRGAPLLVAFSYPQRRGALDR
jgi:hypothetical protein